MPLEIFVFLGAAIIGLVAVGIWGLRASFRPVSGYEGRHRCAGRLSYRQEWQLHRAIQADRRTHAEFEALLADRRWRGAFADLADASGDAREFDTPGQVKGSYAHLRTDELDSTAERFWRLVEKGIRPPSVWGTPSTVDEWDPVPEGVAGYAIAGGTR